MVISDVFTSFAVEVISYPSSLQLRTGPDPPPSSSPLIPPTRHFSPREFHAILNHNTRLLSKMYFTPPKDHLGEHWRCPHFEQWRLYLPKIYSTLEVVLQSCSSFSPPSRKRERARDTNPNFVPENQQLNQ